MMISQNGLGKTYLFNEAILNDINIDEGQATFKPKITPQNPGENLTFRPLCIEDYDRGYLQLLSQLTIVGDISCEMFEDRFNSMKGSIDTYYVTVIEDTETEQVVGAASLVIEQKFIHRTHSRGRIEDVVVSDAYRGRQLGKFLVQCLTLLGKNLGCYKMSLECGDQMMPFYQKIGYKQKDNFMVQKFFD